MIRTLLLLPLVLAAAQNQPVREVISQAMRIGNQLVPGFQSGYMFFLEDGGSIRLYSPQGLPVLTSVIQIPNAVSTSGAGLAVDSDGSVAVSAVYKNSAGYNRGGIVFFGSSGQLVGFVETGRYMPGNICYGEDHSLWTFGWQFDALRPDREDSEDYMMVHRYTSDHKEQGQFLSRSLFPNGLPPGEGKWQSMRITAAHDRVGLLAWSGMNASKNEWVELDLKGNLIRRIRLDEGPLAKLAFTADGHLYHQVPRQPNLQVLDETTSEWKDVDLAPSGRLWGADGNLLVFSPNDGVGTVVLEWFEQPALIASPEQQKPSSQN